MEVLAVFVVVLGFVAPIPVFDQTALFQDVLVPADAAFNSIIYRLRASDPTISYPLIFSLRSEPTTIGLESLNCSRLNSICHANVVLRKRLEAERFYDFEVMVTNQRGEFTSLNCSFRATNATTPINEVFPGAPTLLRISENARRNVELGTITARGNPTRTDGVLMELWGDPQFGLHQRLVNRRDAEATIVLLGALDYETKTMHHLTILANDPWTHQSEDTRNIASWPLLIAVLDEQDTPPVFTLAPPTTSLSPGLQPGDTILRIHAEDGDRGSPREIRYGLVPEGHPFTTFFNISEDTGELKLARPLPEILAISHGGQPILLTVIAEEVRTNPIEPPAQSSTVSLALIPPGPRLKTPVFGAQEYKTLLDENAPIGTILDLPQAEIVAEARNVVTLELLNNNGTFDIAPNVVEGQSKFQVKVRDPKLLDYELWKSVRCTIYAREVGDGNFTASARLEVVLNDVNDNPPRFSKVEYEASVPEDAKPGSSVLRVEALDADRAPSSRIQYHGLSGAGSEYFDVNPLSGVITVRGPLDAELTPELNFQVSAADEDGNGRKATSSIKIHLVDINDKVPEFEKNIYEFILSGAGDAFTTPAFIKATDGDLTAPNNEVHYELIQPLKNLRVNERTGEVFVTQPWTEQDITTLKARAWDGGVPRLFTECEIRIYPSERPEMSFLVPGKNPDLDHLKKTLYALTGADVVIHEVRPYVGQPEKSVVIVTSSDASKIDVKRIQEVLDQYQEKSKIQKATEGNLLWLIILLVVLLLLLALILILCCICHGCPLYIPPKRRKAVSAEIQKVVHGSGLGRESKSVQVAEWFGRREAWTPEDESLHRHEQDRGSDRSEVRRVRHVQREPSRDQLYIRDGNADILRLVTRGNERQDQTYFVSDNGKDILMRRFIDQQQVNLPNAVNKLQTEHELLEASLRQQNALLRQILLDKERDTRLETQSLPAGTQTDQDAGTQTEPFLFRRRVQTDNEASDGSDEEIALIKAKARRRHGRRSLRKIKTPIQEESEVELDKVSIISKTPSVRTNKTSELRAQKTRSAIRKEVLKEISASLDLSEHYSDDSLDDISPRSEKTTSSQNQKYYSESELRPQSPQALQKSQSQNNLAKKPPRKPGASRYMEWYKNPPKKAVEGKKPRVGVETKKEKVKKNGPEHPLLQHSEHRYEGQYVRKRDEDVDSGIALIKPVMTQKKSVFTIAYDDVHTKQLTMDNQSPPL